MTLLTTLSLLIGTYVSICSIIILIEQAYGKRAENRKNAIRHRVWLWNSGLKESAYIVDPGYASWGSFG